MRACDCNYSLQTGMRGAFGKPTGVVARVNIGQIIISVRAADKHKHVVIEALRRSKYKFPGRQNIVVSNLWGFTPYTRDQFTKYATQGMRARGTMLAVSSASDVLCCAVLCCGVGVAGRMADLGAHVKVKAGKGPLNNNSVLIIRKKPVYLPEPAAEKKPAAAPKDEKKAAAPAPKAAAKAK